MEQIKIMFFGICTFFGVENGQIGADKTTVTINPKDNKIDIVQENLFTLITQEKDGDAVIEQWQSIKNWNKRENPWAKELDSFPKKSLNLKGKQSDMKAHIQLNYNTPEDLRAFGIWYSIEKNSFSIHNSPREHVVTDDGVIEGNYLVFKGDSSFSFTVEPFLDMPEKYKKLKQELHTVVE